MIFKFSLTSLVFQARRQRTHHHHSKPVYISKFAFHWRVGTPLECSQTAPFVRRGMQGTDGPSRRSLHSRDVVSCGAVFNRYRHSEDGQVQPDQADHVCQVPETLLGGLHQAGPLYARVVPRLRGWKWALRQER